jgi:hypothetical protein
MLRLFRETFKDLGPSAPQSANVNRSLCLDVHVCDRALDLSHNGLLLQREEGSRSVVSRGLNKILSIRGDELVSVSQSARRAC